MIFIRRIIPRNIMNIVWYFLVEVWKNYVHGVSFKMFRITAYFCIFLCTLESFEWLDVRWNLPHIQGVSPPIKFIGYSSCLYFSSYSFIINVVQLTIYCYVFNYVSIVYPLALYLYIIVLFLIIKTITTFISMKSTSHSNLYV